MRKIERRSARATLFNSAPMAQFSRVSKPRRGGRAVDGSGLEDRQGASPRGFESHPLRHSIADCGLRIADCGKEPASDGVRGHEPDKSGAHYIRKMMRRDVHSRKGDERRDCQKAEANAPTG